MTPHELSLEVQEGLNTRIQRSSIEHHQLTLWVEPSHLIEVATYLFENSRCQFKQLVDLCGVDYLGRVPRFEVVYHFLSHKFNTRIRLKVGGEEDTLFPSLTSLFPAADWWEREAWDMYGLKFSGNPNLRRILTDYGFEGHPLRKDFPLTGFVEVRYDSQEKRVVYEPVNLPQDFRQLDFLSPWEGKIPSSLCPSEEAMSPTHGLTPEKEGPHGGKTS